MPYGNINVDTVTTSTAGGVLGAGNASIMKNRIINGAMVIDQRNAGTAQTGKTSGSYYLDRWQTFQNFGTVTVQQSTTAPTGFSNSFYTTITTANASPSSTAIYTIDQAIEGFNTADLAFGTASAKTITLSFWVRSSITGTYCVYFRNAAQDRFYVAEYTISSANTFEQKSITLTGDTTGTWVGATNGVGLELGFTLGAGSSRYGTAGSWGSSSIYCTSSQTNLVGTNGATFYITGVQLEVGSSATGFEYVNYQTSLANCYRYFYRIVDKPAGGYEIITTGQTASDTGYCAFRYPVTMRTAPTLSYSSVSDFRLWNSGTSDVSVNSLAIGSVTARSLRFNVGTPAIATGYATTFLSVGTTGTLDLSAEL